MLKGYNLQDSFLNTLRQEQVPVAIYLVNGIKLQGQVDAFDQYIVMLKSNITQMVYKHSISTIVPACQVKCVQTDSQVLEEFALEVMQETEI